MTPWSLWNTYLGYDVSSGGNGQLTCTDLGEPDMAYDWTLHRCDGKPGDYCSNTQSGQCLDKNFWSLIPKKSGSVTGKQALQGQWGGSGTNVDSGNLCPEANWCRGVYDAGWCGFAFVDSGSKGIKNDPIGPWYNLVQPCHKGDHRCPGGAQVPDALDDRSSYLTSQSTGEGGHASSVNITQDSGEEGYPDVGLFALEKVAAKEDDAGVY